MKYENGYPIPVRAFVGTPSGGAVAKGTAWKADRLQVEPDRLLRTLHRRRRLLGVIWIGPNYYQALRDFTFRSVDADAAVNMIVDGIRYCSLIVRARVRHKDGRPMLDINGPNGYTTVSVPEGAFIVRYTPRSLRLCSLAELAAAALSWLPGLHEQTLPGMTYIRQRTEFFTRSVPAYSLRGPCRLSDWDEYYLAGAIRPFVLVVEASAGDQESAIRRLSYLGLPNGISQVTGGKVYLAWQFRGTVEWRHDGARACLLPVGGRQRPAPPNSLLLDFTHDTGGVRVYPTQQVGAALGMAPRVLDEVA